MRIGLRVPINDYSGYGKDGIGLVEALIDAGHEVHLAPTHVLTPIPQKIANLLTQHYTPPFDVFIDHHDPMQARFSKAEAYHAEQTVMWSMWESTSLIRAEPPIDFQSFEHASGILAYDHISEEAFRVLKLPTVVLQGGYRKSEVSYMDRDWSSTSPFRFCMLGQLNERKNPFAAIEAFRILTANGKYPLAELHLKTSIPGLHPKMETWLPRCRVHYGNWTQDLVRQFLAGCHCLLAPSLGEGKNLPALEMMASGAPVIVTNWGGHTMWLEEGINGWGLDYELKPWQGNPEDVFAHVDPEQLAEKMAHAYDHREDCKLMGENSAVTIPETCSWDAVVERLPSALTELRNFKGSSLPSRTSSPIRQTALTW